MIEKEAAAPRVYGRERLGEMLEKEGVITAQQLHEVLELQAREGGKLGEVLIRNLVISEDQLAQTLAKQKGLDHVNLAAFPIDRGAASLLSDRFATMRMVMGIAFEDDRLVLAMADPLDIETIDDVEMRTARKVHPVVATASQISYAIDKYVTSADAFADVVQSIEDVEEDEEIVEDVPVVRLVNQLIREAVHERASDIHIEPREREVVVRYRVDGVLHEVMKLPVAARAGITSRLKIMAEMDIAERRRPQDGRIMVRVDDRPTDIRVVTLPTPVGESLVLRVLNSELAFRSIDDVGLTPENRKLLERFMAKPYGAVLVAGPTGSGKSTTLYAALQTLNDPRRKIITVEDPIEYRMPGLTQMAINPKIGLSFATGLRTILRSDPDVVMVGEIRDPDTAEIAVRSALTGHLVLSSIHTNDAPSALTRLTDMGVPPYITSSGLLGVIAQRLVRVLCDKCKEPVKLSGARLVAAGFRASECTDVDHVYRAVGCDACGQSGYRGRLGVFEIMTMTDEVTELFLDRAPSETIRQLALKQGMITLREDALLKVCKGITSLEEVDRVVI